MAPYPDKIQYEGLTFDDVLLLPAYSEVMPHETILTTKFSRNINLNTPIISAAMDTVTDANLAIAIAREGGIGVIHKNMSIKEQAKQVKKVKRAENVMILEPITIQPDATVNDANLIIQEYKIGGIPVVDKDNTLLGIVTNRDLRFELDGNLSIKDIMTTKNLVTTNQETDLSQAAEILQQHKIEKLPIIDDNNKLIGLITYKDISKSKDRPNSCKDRKGRLRVAAAVGIASNTMERVRALVESNTDAVVIDTAHGHTKAVIQILKQVKNEFPGLDVVAGNVGTREGAKALANAGADGIKVGIGPGSICTTRIIAGVGVPQLSAIFNVVDALKDTGIPIIADGGIKYSGDIIKALAA
ncbi:MAG: IMP dehydrogenase, partial [Bacteroidales bacterium]|nr:IMP dehydrogenase [Bacteroidales bacterium]